MSKKRLACILASFLWLASCSNKEAEQSESGGSIAVQGNGPGSLPENPRPVANNDQPMPTMENPVVKNSETTRLATTQNFKLHTDKNGFRIKIPEAWKIETRKNGVILAGSNEATTAIWPFFIPGKQPSNKQLTTSLLQSLSQQLFPNADWQSPENISDAAARLHGTEGTNRIVSILSLAQSDRGLSGILYSSTAAAENYSNHQQVFAEVFESFQLIGAPSQQGQNQENQIRYVRWVDPREQSFSLEVPSGWKTEGGLFRVSALDIRAALQSTSPDGNIRINAGDTNIPTFSEPTPQGVALGFPEGSWYTPGPGSTMMVSRYHTGLGFLLNYLSNTIAPQCGGLQITQQRNRPDLVQNINAVYAQYNTGMTFTLDAGEATFECNQGTIEGYYLAATKRTQAYGTGIWNVEYLYGFLAAKGQAGLANKVLGHMVNSSQLNPEWVRMQQGITANVSAIAARTSQEISEIISSSYWNQQQTYDELSRRRSNATLGVQDVVDPVTGQEYKVESGSNYYWVDHRGTIVGTDVYARPSLDFRELTQLP